MATINLGQSDLKLTIVRSGTDALVYASVQGQRVVLLKLLVAGFETSNAAFIRWFREGDYFVGGEQIEPNIVILKAVLNGVPAGAQVQARAEYLVLDHVTVTEKVTI
jgi:hypothetical protein